MDRLQGEIHLDGRSASRSDPAIVCMNARPGLRVVGA